MDSDKPQDKLSTDHPTPLLVWHRSESESADEPRHTAALRSRPDTPLATISASHQPAGMWMLTMFPHGRHRQFVVYFPSLATAMRAVETWARHDATVSETG